MIKTKYKQFVLSFVPCLYIRVLSLGEKYKSKAKCNLFRRRCATVINIFWALSKIATLLSISHIPPWNRTPFLALLSSTSTRSRHARRVVFHSRSPRRSSLATNPSIFNAYTNYTSQRKASKSTHRDYERPKLHESPARAERAHNNLISFTIWSDYSTGPKRPIGHSQTGDKGKPTIVVYYAGMMYSDGLNLQLKTVASRHARHLMLARIALWPASFCHRNVRIAYYRMFAVRDIQCVRCRSPGSRSLQINNNSAERSQLNIWFYEWTWVLPIFYLSVNTNSRYYWYCNSGIPGKKW